MLDFILCLHSSNLLWAGTESDDEIRLGGNSVSNPSGPCRPGQRPGVHVLKSFLAHVSGPLGDRSSLSFFSVGTWMAILSKNKAFWGKRLYFMLSCTWELLQWFVLYLPANAANSMRADTCLQLLLVHRAPCQWWPSLGSCRAPCSGSPRGPSTPSFAKSLGQEDGLKITSVAKGSLTHPTDHRLRSVHRLDICDWW